MGRQPLDGKQFFRWGSNLVTTSSSLTTSRWYHLAVIFDSSKASLYVDGIFMASSNGINPELNSHPFLIGAMYDSDTPLNPKNSFHGWIEEVRIWKTALTKEQLRFMMNQRLEAGSGTNPVKGDVLPLQVPSNLTWDKLDGYYQLMGNQVTGGLTLDKASVKIDGQVKNVITIQENTAPLPYISNSNGVWTDRNTWKLPTIYNGQTLTNRDVWDAPNSKGIDNSTPIDWNIARISKNIYSGGNNITLLGLLSESDQLTITGDNADKSGQGLTISHYLKLDGIIDLNGESQLVQTQGSILDETSSGYIERDQQGKRNSFVYNYWSSPVSKQRAVNNASYDVKSVLMDGTTASNPQTITFDNQYWIADWGRTSPITISTYWLWGYSPAEANNYSEWDHIFEDGPLKTGEGFTMKGTDGTASISAEQNYTFRGKPHNGDIVLPNIAEGQNYLIGNPYPSAIDANKFILDNLNANDVTDATNTRNIFNGALYFWDHFAEKTHILAEYIGGYATRNLIDGVPAASTDERINANDAQGTKIPGQFISVAQGFFINSAFDSNLSENYSINGGNVIFKNSQRSFVKETNGNSQFLRPESNSKKDKQADTPSKIRLDFRSPMGYHR